MVYTPVKPKVSHRDVAISSSHIEKNLKSSSKHHHNSATYRKSIRYQTPLLKKKHDSSYYTEKALPFADPKCYHNPHYCKRANGEAICHGTTRICLGDRTEPTPHARFVSGRRHNAVDEHTVVRQVASELTTYTNSQHAILISSIWSHHEHILRHADAVNEEDAELLHAAEAEIRLFQRAYGVLGELSKGFEETFKTVVELLENAWLKHEEAKGELERICEGMREVGLEKGGAVEELIEMMGRIGEGWEGKVERSEKESTLFTF